MPYLIALWTGLAAWGAAVWANRAALFSVVAPSPVVVPAAFTMAATLLPIWLLWQQNALIATQTEFVRTQTNINAYSFEKEANQNDSLIDDAIGKLDQMIALVNDFRSPSFEVRAREDETSGTFSTARITALEFRLRTCVPNLTPGRGFDACTDLGWVEAIASLRANPLQTPPATQAVLNWLQYMRYFAVRHQAKMMSYSLAPSTVMGDFVKSATEVCATAANESGLRAIRLAVTIVGLGEASRVFGETYLQATATVPEIAGGVTLFTNSLRPHIVGLGTLMSGQDDRVQSAADLDDLTGAAFFELHELLQRVRQTCREKKEQVASYRRWVRQPR